MKTRRIELRCWVCEEVFAAEEPSYWLTAGRWSDLCPRPVDVNPLPLLVHACPGCGFAGDARCFRREAADEQVRKWVVAGGIATTEKGADTGYGRYERAALCHARRRKPSLLQLGEFYLAASWSAQLEGAPEAVSAFQAEAATYLERALLAGEIADGERAVMTYLVGELHRRLGEFRTALQLFDEAALEFTRHGGPRWLLRALGQQAGLARNGSCLLAELAR